MNINALLSPSDSPARDDSSSSASPPAKAATPYASRKRSALNREVSQEESRSPESDRSTAAFPSASSHAFPGPSASRGTVPNFRPLHPPPTSHPAASSSAPPPQGGVAQTLYQPMTSARRTSSTPQMETLAGALISPKFRLSSLVTQSMQKLTSRFQTWPRCNGNKPPGLSQPTTSALPCPPHRVPLHSTPNPHPSVRRTI